MTGNWGCTKCGMRVESIGIPTGPCDGCGQGPAWTESWNLDRPSSAAAEHTIDRAFGEIIPPPPPSRSDRAIASLRRLMLTISAVLNGRPLPDRNRR